MSQKLTVRITLMEPVPGVSLAAQSGKADLLAPTGTADGRVWFDLPVEAREADGRPDFRGAVVQGKPGERFIYVNSGRRAGQPLSDWERRAKIPLAGIRAEQVAAAHETPGAVLEARIDGRARDGGPCCATVPLLEGWRVLPAGADQGA